MVSRWRQAIALLLIVFALSLASCGGDGDVPVVLLEGDDVAPASNPLTGTLAEVSPPELIQQLKPYLDVYEPQVRIVSPRSDETLEDTTAAVELQVRDFFTYKDQDLGLGPHLHLFLDDQPYRAVYNTDEPIIFENLAPGTHTLRVFASRPWHESFKNAGAYDQVTFNVFTESPDHNPDDSKALLTYSRPQGHYGAEPIMLDFYLTNAPLHIVAQNDESVTDWRIRCTVNGESFVFDRWQPIYLTGFKPGKNWVKLELIDENGNLIDNAFNTAIRVIEYTPDGDDGLSKLIRGEIPLSRAKVLVDPNYVPPAPEVKEAPTPTVPAAPAEEPASPKTELTPKAETERQEAPVQTESTGAPVQPEEAPTVEQPIPAKPLTPGKEGPPTRMVPTAKEPKAKPKQTTPMSTPEPTAEPGMLPEIIEKTEQPEVAPKSEVESAPEDQSSASTIAPTTPEEPPAPPESTVQSPAGSVVLPDTVEEFAPPSEPEASPASETPNTLESRRPKRPRSRFSRDRLMRRNSPEQAPEPTTVPETEAPASETQPTLETEKPNESINSSENSPQKATGAPPAEPSPTVTDSSTPESATETNDSRQPNNLPEEDESALESLEEESDVI